MNPGIRRAGKDPPGEASGGQAGKDTFGGAFKATVVPLWCNRFTNAASEGRTWSRWACHVTDLVFSATLSVSDVLSDDSLHLLSEHRILSQLKHRGQRSETEPHRDCDVKPTTNKNSFFLTRLLFWQSCSSSTISIRSNILSSISIIIISSFLGSISINSSLQVALALAVPSVYTAWPCSPVH